MPIFYSSQFRPSLHTNNTRIFFIVSYARDPVKQSVQFHTQNKPTAARPRVPAGISFIPFCRKSFSPLPRKTPYNRYLPAKAFLPLSRRKLFCLFSLSAESSFFVPSPQQNIFFRPPFPRGRGDIGGWAGKCKQDIFVSSTLSRTACDPPCPFGHPPLTLVLRGAEAAPQPKVLQKKRTSAEYADVPCLERRQQPILPGR